MYNEQIKMIERSAKLIFGGERRENTYQKCQILNIDQELW